MNSPELSERVWQFFKLWFQNHLFDDESTGFYGELFSSLVTTYRASQETAARVLSNWLIDDDYAVRRRILPLLHMLLHKSNGSLNSNVVYPIEKEFTAKYKNLGDQKRSQLIDTLSSLRFVNPFRIF